MALEGEPGSILGIGWFLSFWQKYYTEQAWNEEDVVLVYGRVVQNSIAEYQTWACLNLVII
jgi:hypothetical protein